MHQILTRPIHQAIGFQFLWMNARAGPLRLFHRGVVWNLGNRLAGRDGFGGDTRCPGDQAGAGLSVVAR